MRLLALCMLAVTGWVAAAPGKKDTTEDLQKETEGDNLAPALSELARRKRGGTKPNLPYSNYRPTGGMHRYRYPLYRKRSSRPQPVYDYEDEVILPESVGDYFDYENQLRGPSLFRERNTQQDRKKKDMLLEDNGYFTDDFLPENKAVAMPLKKRDSVYNLANSPYDLHTIRHMYEAGKRDDSPIPFASDFYDLENLGQVHGVGRKNSPTLSTAEQFYDAIDAIKRKAAMFDERIMTPTEDEKLEQLINLKNFLSSSSANRYLSSATSGGQDMSYRNPMIRRRKRDTAAPANPNVVVKTNNTAETQKDLASTIPSRYQQSQISGDRRKRGFNDYFNWERKAIESEYEPSEKRSNKDLNDYLTREYFKSIARSVGQKKKRMAYAQFEADKRSSGLDEFLENPSMLEYMQSKLREAEEEVAVEAEKELGEGDNEELLSNIVVRLDALERMREALGRLQELQTEEAERPQRSMPTNLSGTAKKRTSAASKKRSNVSRKKKNSLSEARKVRRLRRGDGSLQALFLGNTREECPVLDRVLLNCESVSEMVGDQDQAFLEPCIRHEICYMCGSGLSVSGHECDAILSSALEAACTGTLECLSAAGETFNLLSNAERYDEGGTCTHDPCVRQYLESR